MSVSTAKPPVSSILSVFDERRCIGLILRRGPAGVEGFTAENTSLGLFRTEDAAAAAIWKQAHGQSIEPLATPDLLAGEKGDPA
jgi:hypothetical protein